MKTAELVAEHLAAWKVTTESDLDELVRYGLPRQLIQQIRPAVANIVVDKKGELYAPDEAGVRAWVLPVRVFDPEMPDVIEAINPVWAVSCSDVIDLVAFSPAAPRRFALRRGIATVLGSIEPQYLAPDAVPIHRDITDWLRDNGRGLVLLTRCPFEAARVLRQCLEIEAEDVAHAIQLRRILAESLPKWPQIRTRCRAGVWPDASVV